MAPILWKFQCFVDRRGKSEVFDWVHNTLSKKARQNLKRTLEQLAMKPKEAWSRPSSSPIGNHIYVIRFKDENSTQWRLYGEHDDSAGIFLITNYGTERGGKYVPPSDESAGLAKRRMYESGNAGAAGARALWNMESSG